MCVCVFARAQACARVHVCVCICRPEQDVGCLPQSFSAILPGDRVSHWKGSPFQLGLPGQSALGICLSPYPNAVGIDTCTWMLGIQS